jgi:two-component system CheB/CheR fusion protein
MASETSWQSTAPQPLSADLATFPIVGIGASAGGLAAFEAFFSGLPKGVNPGMAFVLVQHLAPDHKSMLTELIRRYTDLPVFEVVTSVVVQTNCVYIIPPKHNMALLGGSLQLLEPTAPRGQRLPIDFFFKSLAADQRELAIGIVLSGTGSDGTLGVRAIKGAGGMVIAQTPDLSEFDGMPRSAVATGVVDYVLAANQMFGQLVSYLKYSFGKLPDIADQAGPVSESALKKIFALLRHQVGHDFSQYKPSTINRRIARRMSVHQIDSIDDYVHYLQQMPQEVEALFSDLLIGVTHFFRDPEAFQALEVKVIPTLFANKSDKNAVIRVWVAGCSTGEEAYSIAILLHEQMAALKQNYSVQVFASDIDSRSIAYARVGLYPLGIAADVTEARLARYFTEEPDGSGYRIQKCIRDMMVFSEQDLARDPPFSKLDLLTCRNLLIYLTAELQKRLLPMFHYALNPRGVLFLGTSEGIGDFLSLFGSLDRKAKLYLRKPTELDVPRSPSRLLLAYTGPEPEPSASWASVKEEFPAKRPLRELTEQAMLAQLIPVGALVNAQGDIAYLHGRTGMFLEPSPGEMLTANILKMAREGLRPPMTNALFKASTSQEVVRISGVRVKTNGHFTRVNLLVCPADKPNVSAHDSADIQRAMPVPAPLYLVILEEALDQQIDEATLHSAPVAGVTAVALDGADASTQIADLQDELRAKEEYLHSTTEELERSNEELKSSVEEMQSVNEELQSTNEELETAKEELQSVNEELSTVNNELNVKVDDLSRANNDMNNLLAGTGIATVFVDHQLRIMRFTPTASRLINLIPGDVGRPVGHIVSNLVGYTSLVSDTQAVLDSLEQRDVQVQTAEGAWFSLRIRPYRTLDNVIEGAVITFTNIDDIKQAEAALAQANRLTRLAVVIHDAIDAIIMSDLDGKVLAWNPAAERMYGWTEAQALQLTIQQRVPEALIEASMLRLRQLCQAQVLGPLETQRLTRSGTVLNVSLIATALMDAKGVVYAISTTERLR